MVNPRFVIKAVLSGQRLNINVPLTVAGTVNYIGVEAKCTSEWDDCTVVCYIYQAVTGYTAQLGLIYDAERKLYYFPNAERLKLSAGEWAIWFVGVVAESGQEKYKVTSETRYFTVYEYPFASSIPDTDITLGEEAIARATDAQNKANLVLDLYNAGKLTGAKGDPGDPAKIGFVQASVDNTTTNPRCSVDVTENPQGTYNMQFDFSGIKGEKGDTGATGPKGDTGATGAPGRDGTDGRDGEDGRTIDDYVLVQDEQPTSETNKMWLKPTAGADPIMIPSAEEFEGVADDVSNLTDSMHYLHKDVTAEFIDGGYIKTDINTGITVNTPVPNAAYRYAVIECEYGDWCEIHTNGAGGARGFAFVDANGNRLAASNANANTDRVYIAPPNTKYLVINDKIADTEYSCHIGVPVETQTKINAIIRKIEDQISQGLPVNPADLAFTPGTYTMYGNYAYYFEYPYNPPSVTRIKCFPNAFILLPKWTEIKTDGTTQFYCEIKDFDGKITQTGWADSLVVQDAAYYLIIMKNTDNSAISDIDATVATLSIKPPSYAQKTVDNSWRNVHFLDISHRGYQYEAPESTLAAFVRAKANGYNGIELDLRITSDGKYVVHHDNGMPSDNTYTISAHTLDELRTNANMGTYNGITQQILTFEDALKIAKNLDMVLLVELKATFTTTQIGDIIKLAKDLNMSDQTYWMGSYNSSNFDYAGNFRTIDPNCLLLVYDTTNAANVQPFVVSGKDITFCYARATYITAAVVKAMAAIGVKTISWCVTFSWLLPGYTEEQIKAKIVDNLTAGVAGMVLDQWTTADIVRDLYADYL